MGRRAVVASAFPHFGEEDCLRGWNGSGTIFFSLCNLRCVFCQNWDISQKAAGAECPPGEIAELMLDAPGARLPQHQLRHARARRAPGPRGDRRRPSRAGCDLPIVYNTSAYDSVESLRLLDGVVDIYMPDFKFWERGDGPAAGQGEGLPGAGAGGDPGDAPTGRRAAVRRPTGWRGAGCWCGTW